MKTWKVDNQTTTYKFNDQFTLEITVEHDGISIKVMEQSTLMFTRFLTNGQLGIEYTGKK